MRIPSMPNAESAAPLRRVLERVAEQSGMSPYLVALVASRLLEEVADEVSCGHAVSFPGFGLWAPVARRVRGATGEPSVVRCTPRFSASRAFREQTRLCCPLTTTGLRKIRQHGKNHAPNSRATRGSSRVFSSQSAIRAAIAAQMSGDVSLD